MKHRTYRFDYNSGDAMAIFKVDMNMFTNDHARALLDFFTWDFDEDADPIDELMKKYAIKAIWIATSENYNIIGVKDWFSEQEGFIPLDGSNGITLISIEQYDFNEDLLDVTVEFE